VLVLVLVLLCWMVRGAVQRQRHEGGKPLRWPAACEHL